MMLCQEICLQSEEQWVQNWSESAEREHGFTYLNVNFDPTSLTYHIFQGKQSHLCLHFENSLFHLTLWAIKNAQALFCSENSTQVQICMHLKHIFVLIFGRKETKRGNAAVGCSSCW